MPMKQTLVKPRSTLNKSEINSRDANYAMETQNIINVITGNITKSNKSFKSTIIILALSVISPEIIESTEEAEQSDSSQRSFSAVGILNLGAGKRSKDIIKNYYRRINDLKGSKLDQISAWIDSKPVNSE
ncbi:768_t:CDS:2 [Ambispora gerdemannii]|uniref:768_t:CDS:1 n=1 Tax=Ambispora gerdemannii TaxID=144530 RepID=A0A9N9G0P1_9GLOM|nr:768_t:CDS:2 [Ambispora gerdemannii]